MEVDLKDEVDLKVEVDLKDEVDIHVIGNMNLTSISSESSHQCTQIVV